MEVYEGRQNSWKRLISLGDTFVARSGHTAVMDKENSQIYVFGGYTGQEVLNDVSVFNVSESSWKIL